MKRHAKRASGAGSKEVTMAGEGADTCGGVDGGGGTPHHIEVPVSLDYRKLILAFPKFTASEPSLETSEPSIYAPRRSRIT